MTRSSHLITLACLWACSALGLCACKSLSSPPKPVCREGQHHSAGHCCAPGEEWVPARSGCHCIDRAICGSKPATARRPEPDASAKPSGHPCLGTWTGSVRTSEGDGGSVSISVEALTAGTLSRPHSKTCGRIEERWRGSGEVCRARLVRCAHNGAIVIAYGSPIGDSACEGPMSITVRCDDKAASYRRTEDDLAITGKLTTGADER